MYDTMLDLIHFDQTLILPKYDYELLEREGYHVLLLYRGATRCRPYLHFRPLNLSERYTEYDFSELLFECYEGHLEVLSYSVTETTDTITIQTRYALRNDDPLGKLNGLQFSYYQEIWGDESDPVFHYQVENAMYAEFDTSIPNRPLALELNGTLSGEAVKVPLVGSYLCPTE
ncbi:hypothetical protein ABT56_12450 [Photobacterium aquae]|uniref:Uncharacterized protein n=1 Tax=Photobacterium aquae TaxID=1195763 RepID=A0A0J1H033_9GAMM|nr:hypothetical protein [Photobacterium aquae]KLV05188.1 hypothetical protein ABT56_12450 [Photobacterium aquae]